jgi:hypothetical protein
MRAVTWSVENYLWIPLGDMYFLRGLAHVQGTKSDLDFRSISNEANMWRFRLHHLKKMAKLHRFENGVLIKYHHVWLFASWLQQNCYQNPMEATKSQKKYEYTVIGH